METATPDNNNYPLVSVLKLDKVIILTVACVDYEAYTKLPNSLIYNEVVCPKAGWDSDKQIACFTSEKKYAKAN